MGALRPVKLIFMNESVGRGIDGMRQIISTSDGGRDWEMISDIDITWILDLQFFDESNGLLLCADYGRLDNGNSAWHDIILKTSDGGNTWDTVYRQHGSSFWCGTLCMPNLAMGWVVNSWGEIVHTVDSGQSWQQQYYDHETSLTDGYFLNSQVGWAVGQYGTILHTTNGGL